MQIFKECLLFQATNITKTNHDRNEWTCVRVCLCLCVCASVCVCAYVHVHVRKLDFHHSLIALEI